MSQSMRAGQEFGEGADMVSISGGIKLVNPETITKVSKLNIHAVWHTVEHWIILRGDTACLTVRVERPQGELHWAAKSVRWNVQTWALFSLLMVALFWGTRVGFRVLWISFDYLHDEAEEFHLSKRTRQKCRWKGWKCRVREKLDLLSGYSWVRCARYAIR
jgi:hypothetical protein